MPRSSVRRNSAWRSARRDLRGELTLMRAARALASLEGAAVVDDSYLRRIAPVGVASSPATRSARRCRLYRARRTRDRRTLRRMSATGPHADEPSHQVIGMGGRDDGRRPVCARSELRRRQCARRRGTRARRLARAVQVAAADVRRLCAVCPRTSTTTACSAASTWSPPCVPGGLWLKKDLLAAADGGAVVVAGAERLSSLVAARLAAASETGEVIVERDGVDRALSRAFRNGRTRRRQRGRRASACGAARATGVPHRTRSNFAA